MTNRSPLHQVHDAHGARFVDFGGWEMPVQYKSVLGEHAAVRQRAGVFDVSHLGRFRFSGRGATKVLRHELCNDVERIEPGRAQYTMALNDAGGVEDDIIVVRVAAEDYWVLPNGANFDEILARFEAADGPDPVARRHDTVMLAVQGPEAPGVLDAVLGTSPGRFRYEELQFEGEQVWTSGTGYTGESGAELIAPAPVGEALFGALIEAGAEPCGLGSRDTLRLEMGYPLWGQDLGSDTTPLEADLAWVVDWDHDFVGKGALQSQRSAGLAKLLIGFTTEGRRFARHGYPAQAGESRGVVASGNFSPTLGHGIGMAYLSPPPDEHDQIEVDIRGTWLAAKRHKPPFLAR